MLVRKFSSVIVKVASDKEDLYLLRKRRKIDKAMCGHMECPEGELREDETFREAAEREYLEETEVEVRKLAWKLNYSKIRMYEGELTTTIVQVYETTVWIGEVADMNYKIPYEEDQWKIYNEAKVLLMDNIDSINEYLKRKYQLKVLPRLLIIEGSDGSGKTTNLEKIKQEFQRRKIGFLHNTKKRRKYPGEAMLDFRKAVVKQRNENLTEGLLECIKAGIICQFIIVDKSPYVEYFYQKTNWDHERLEGFEQFLLEKQIFELKDVLDAAFVIHLRNPFAWANYYNREQTIEEKSFKTMSYETYKQMKRNFEEYAPKLYKEHIFAHVLNNEEAWKTIWKIIEENLL
jgi:thymidylate kinase/ADP-ribose pyrophosphatase YjhB (NUDIX family)